MDCRSLIVGSDLNIPSWPPVIPHLNDALRDCIDSGDWGRYDSISKRVLTERLIDLFSVKHVQLCCSGTAAIELALRAGGVTAGDLVAVSAFDYPGNFRTIELLGAKPMLVDAANENFGMSVSSLQSALHAVEPRSVRAVIVSHLYGTASDVHAIKSICNKSQCVLIEDACQSPGMWIDAQPAGSFGDLSTLSFGGSKPLTAGNGGAVMTSEDRFASRISSLIHRPSDTYAMNAIGASLLLPQLDQLKQWNERRYRTAIQIAEALKQNSSTVRCMIEKIKEVQPAYYKLAFQCESTEFRNRLVHSGIELGLPFGEPFRAMSGSSERRSAKPVSLAQADRYANTLCVLDHRALLISEEQSNELASIIVRAIERAKLC